MDLPSEPLCLTQERIWDPKHLDRLSVKKNGRRGDLGRLLGPSSSSARFIEQAPNYQLSHDLLPT